MKKTVLIVDDSSTIRKFISFSLTMHGFKVLTACDGMEALERLPAQNVDLIITDLNMPNLDGFELIQSVRQSEQYNELPIIILSSLEHSREIERGMSYGANSYLVKPFDPQRVHYEVSKYLN